MKQLIIASILIFAVAFTSAQTKDKKVPSVTVKALNGSSMNVANAIANSGNPVVISFWATWCSPCKKELNEIAEVYEDWQEETGVKLIAVSIDDTRNTSKVAPYVNGKGWEYEVLLDPNGDFKRAMNVNNVPHTFLLNSNGEIVWQHNGYTDEATLYSEILKVKK